MSAPTAPAVHRPDLRDSDLRDPDLHASELRGPAMSAPEPLLSPEVVQRLRQPFAPGVLRWKIQTRVNEQQADPYATVVVYVDARTVAAHLDDVVPGRWSTVYAAPPVTVGLPALECRLTVCGVTRSDVGTVEPGSRAGSDTKDLYSDALKRAAVQYGVGAFLYRFPQVQARVERSGQTWYVTREAQAELRVLTRAVLAGEGPLPRFQALRVRDYQPGAVSGVTAPGSAPGNVSDLARSQEPEEGPPPIGEERGLKMEEQLRLALRGSEWEGDRAHDFATFVLGFQVSALPDLTELEARTVYRAAKASLNPTVQTPPARIPLTQAPLTQAPLTTTEGEIIRIPVK